ncbi:MAG: aldolase/citrate lyase family protein [Eubacterium sp.]|nr:aldolase/citrate lyase family protein [Eubacterium sp.]
MNSIKRQLLDSLRKLEEYHGVEAIKAEFEAEGSRLDELIMLNEVVFRADMELIIKIGGCEAVRDLDQCKLLGASGVMVPMIETPFAMEKFIGAYHKVYGEETSAERIINAETITCLENYDEILSRGKGFLTGATVGRSDLSASMGIDKSDIESDAVFDATMEFVKKSRNAGLVTNFGGGIGVESIPFIIRMSPFIDRFETRKVVIRSSEDSDWLKKTIQEALRFELLYLEYKASYYDAMSKEDSKRMKRLKGQLN